MLQLGKIEMYDYQRRLFVWLVLWPFCYQRLKLRSLQACTSRQFNLPQSAGHITPRKEPHSHQARRPLVPPAAGLSGPEGSQSGHSACSVLCTSSGRRFGLLFA